MKACGLYKGLRPFAMGERQYSKAGKEVKPRGNVVRGPEVMRRGGKRVRKWEGREVKL
ncbi:hypothetical protein H709_00183 [Bartonella bacilliformis CUSCO5]|nr:hypothetical protein X470_01189 [Bartonella bacilliformis Peru-18]KEG18259.1 hypothetical protein H709_00183 [Bartonella bacilliformis CUSCO5]